MDDPYTSSREAETIKEESSTTRRAFNRCHNGHMIGNSRKCLARRKEHTRLMAKDTPVSLWMLVTTVVDDLILAESSWNTVDLRNTAS